MAEGQKDILSVVIGFLLELLGAMFSIIKDTLKVVFGFVVKIIKNRKKWLW